MLIYIYMCVCVLFFLLQPLPVFFLSPGYCVFFSFLFFSFEFWGPCWFSRPNRVVYGSVWLSRVPCYGNGFIGGRHGAPPVATTTTRFPQLKTKRKMPDASIRRFQRRLRFVFGCVSPFVGLFVFFSSKRPGRRRVTDEQSGGRMF